jgi:hypothetical protein
MRKIVPVMILMVFSLFSFAEDILILKDGESFKGKVTRIKKCHVHFKTEIGTFLVPIYDIDAVQLDNPRKRILRKYKLMLNPPRSEECKLGEQDAYMYHGKRGGHFVLGFLFGPFAIVGTVLATPTPGKGVRTIYMSENRDLFTDPHYLNCYESKARNRLLTMEAIGWGAAIVLILLLSATY